ncbi:MAG: hypothetical protein MK074_02210 [Phycisphaerales bacterium]|nr:hypothetical protein [Phycisphaerales bacterium]
MDLQGIRKSVNWILGIALVLMVICAIAALFVDDRKVGMLAGTAFLTTMLAGVLHASVRQFEGSRARWGGFVSAVLALIAWIMLVWTIWAETLFGRGGVNEDTLLLTALACLCCWPTMYTGASGIHTARVRLASRILLGTSVAVFIGWAGGIWLDIDELTLVNIFIPMAIGGVLCAVISLRSIVPLPAQCIAIAWCAGTMCYWSAGMQLDWSWTGQFESVSIVLSGTFGPAGIAAVALLGMIRLRSRRWVRTTTMICVCCALLAWAMVIWFETAVQWREGAEVAARAGATTSILSAVGVLVLLLLHRIENGLVFTRHDTPLQVQCPRCRELLMLQQGKTACPHCMLKFNLQFESPACRSCGYGLAPQFPERCPECGTSVRVDISPHEPATALQDAT